MEEITDAYTSNIFAGFIFLTFYVFQYFGKFVVKKYVFLTYVIVQSEKINAQKHVKKKYF